MAIYKSDVELWTSAGADDSDLFPSDHSWVTFEILVAFFKDFWDCVGEEVMK
jgi:hypothetical protein